MIFTSSFWPKVLLCNIFSLFTMFTQLHDNLHPIYCNSWGYFFCGSLVYFVSCASHALRLLIADLWSPAGKRLTSWLLMRVFIVFVLLSHMVSWVRSGT